MQLACVAEFVHALDEQALDKLSRAEGKRSELAELERRLSGA